MAQYEVSILETHPSCGREEANQKSFRRQDSLAARLHPPEGRDGMQRSLEEAGTGLGTEMLLGLRDYLEEPGHAVGGSQEAAEASPHISGGWRGQADRERRGGKGVC